MDLSWIVKKTGATFGVVKKEEIINENESIDVNGKNGTVQEESFIAITIEDEDDQLTNGETKICVQEKHMCDVCSEKEFKYTCPGCSIKTCSLACVNDHKSKLSCSGERNKTEFVEMSLYTDQILLNDYRFLEEAERTLYSNKYVPNNRHQRTQKFLTTQHYSKRSKLLMAAALKRGVKLKMLPTFLSRNKENTSYYTVKSDTIAWHMEWLFTTTTTLRVKDERVPETSILVSAASKFTNVVEYQHLRKSLEDFPTDKMTKCHFLLKIEGLPANMKRYIVLNSESTIRENLQGHCVTEYPSIIVLPGHYDINSYIILSKDDMPFMTSENQSYMTRYRPDLSLKDEESMTKLLNPKSSLYTASTGYKY